MSKPRCTGKKLDTHTHTQTQTRVKKHNILLLVFSRVGSLRFWRWDVGVTLFYIRLIIGSKAYVHLKIAANELQVLLPEFLLMV